MNSTDKFDTETLRSNAEYINDSLVSRGYTKRRILLPSTDHGELSPNPIEITAAIFSNDSNIIDTLLHMFETIKRTKEQLKQASAAISSKDEQIARLTARALGAERKAESALAKYQSSISRDHLIAQDTISTLKHKVKSQRTEISRLKSVCSEYTTKYQVDMKRKSLEIDDLRNRLTDTRQPSSAVTFGIPNTGGSYTRRLTPNIIYGTHAILKQNSDLNTQGMEFFKNAVTNEEDAIVVVQRSIINDLTLENRKLALFLQKIDSYFEAANSSMASLELGDLASYNLPDPGTVLDQSNDGRNDSLPFELFCDQVQVVDEISKPILSNINQFYHNISTLLPHLELGREDGLRIKELEDQVEKILRSCEDAWRTVEDWKRYYQSEQKKTKQ